MSQIYGYIVSNDLRQEKIYRFLADVILLKMRFQLNVWNVKLRVRASYIKIWNFEVKNKPDHIRQNGPG